MADQSRVPSRSPGNGRDRGITKSEPPAIVGAEQSAGLRDRLLAEIGNIASAELAAGWARKALAAKNKLAESDAKLVEDAFEQRLSGFASAGTLLAMMLWPMPMQVLLRRARPQALTLIEPRASIDPTGSTRVSLPLPRRGGTATGSTFAVSPSSHASYAVASHPTRITCATCSRARSAARPAMNSPCRSAASIIAPYIG